MANYPKKMNDPTEAALSAIQEALNVHEEDEQPASPAAAAPDLFATPTESPSQIAETDHRRHRRASGTERGMQV